MTPWISACQATLSTISWSFFKSMSIESVMLRISCSAIPSPPALNLSQHQVLFQWVIFFTSDGQSTGASASASVLPMNIQGWCLLGLTGWISLLSKGLSRVFSSTTIQTHQFSSAFLYGPTVSSIPDYWKKKKNHSVDYTVLCWQNDVSAFEYAL